MKAYSNDSKFQISLFGDTGYANKSYLMITMSDFGILTVDRNNWDISSLDISKVTRIELSIPSGEFDLKVSSFLLEEDLITFSGCGSWNGNQGGLCGGMSGYGNFWMEPDIHVISGLFHYYKGGFIKKNPTILEYNAIKNRSRALSKGTWEEILENEGIVASQDIYSSEWHEWIKYLQTDEAIQKELELGGN